MDVYPIKMTTSKETINNCCVCYFKPTIIGFYIILPINMFCPHSNNYKSEKPSFKISKPRTNFSYILQMLILATSIYYIFERYKTCEDSGTCIILITECVHIFCGIIIGFCFLLNIHRFINALNGWIKVLQDDFLFDSKIITYKILKVTKYTHILLSVMFFSFYVVLIILATYFFKHFNEIIIYRLWILFYSDYIQFNVLTKVYFESVFFTKLRKSSEKRIKTTLIKIKKKKPIEMPGLLNTYSFFKKMKIVFEYYNAAIQSTIFVVTIFYTVLIILTIYNLVRRSNHNEIEVYFFGIRMIVICLVIVVLAPRMDTYSKVSVIVMVMTLFHYFQTHKLNQCITYI